MPGGPRSVRAALELSISSYGTTVLTASEDVENALAGRQSPEAQYKALVSCVPSESVGADLSEQHKRHA